METPGLVGEVRDFLAELRRELPELYPSPANRESARRKIEERLAFWSGRMGVRYGRVSIRDQRTRWGSCSSKGNLNFNWRLVFAPQAVMDYVVIHELAHLREMNHSKCFWRFVAEHSPDYREHRRWLHENHRALRRRREAQVQEAPSPIGCYNTDAERPEGRPCSDGFGPGRNLRTP